MDHRTLKEEELELWFEHLASVFVNTPHDYFVRHWINDPYASLADIFVSYDTTKKTPASTVKVYRREFYNNGAVQKVGGIGEVSTKQEYRSQGLAQHLLELAISHMTNTGLNISALSASKARGYYEKMSWKVVPYLIASQKISPSAIQKSNASIEGIKVADFSEAQVKQLIAVHHFYARHFNGPIYRAEPTYWTKWIKSEAALGDGQALMMEGPGGNVVGFACIAVMSPNTIVVKDFFVGEAEWGKEQGKEVLQSFLKYFVSTSTQVQEQDSQEWIVRYPAAIIIGEKLYDESVDLERKETYLYRVLASQSETDDLIQQLGGKYGNRYVMWEVDKF